MSVRYKRKLVSDLVKGEMVDIIKIIDYNIKDKEYMFGVVLEQDKPMYKLLFIDSGLDIMGETKSEFLRSFNMFLKFSK